MNERGPDPAIQKGLVDAGCQIYSTHGVAQTLNALRAYSESVILEAEQARRTNRTDLLVAEVQAGAISLLTLLREDRIPVPPTILFDQDGDNIHQVIEALQFGVQDYMLAVDPPSQRELRVRLLAERIAMRSGGTTFEGAVAPLPAPPAVLGGDFRWDPRDYVLHVGYMHVRLSPVEGRIFDMLLSRRNHAVSMSELIGGSLTKSSANVREGIRLLRPHIMRLRSKLEHHPGLAHRITNVRGNGYMFI